LVEAENRDPFRIKLMIVKRLCVVNKKGKERQWLVATDQKNKIK
jgi:hypothetical protein